MSSSKVNIDFLVQSSVYFLSICDLSEWGLIENEPAIIEITMPGYSTPITKYFDKKQLNVFNSRILEINCSGDCQEVENVSLPDGIYTIKVTGSPSTFNKEHHYLKSDMLEMEIDKIYIDNRKKDKNFIDKLTDIEFSLKSASAHLRFDDIYMAGEMFSLAQDMVEELKNCTNCK